MKKIFAVILSSLILSSCNTATESYKKVLSTPFEATLEITFKESLYNGSLTHSSDNSLTLGVFSENLNNTFIITECENTTEAKTGELAFLLNNDSSLLYKIKQAIFYFDEEKGKQEGESIVFSQGENTLVINATTNAIEKISFNGGEVIFSDFMFL